MFFNKSKKDKIHSDLELLCGGCIDYLQNHLKKPDFKGCSIHFDNIVKSWNVSECGLRIVKSYKGDGIFVLEIYASYPDNSGYEMKNFLIHGTKEELSQYLAREEMKTEMMDSYSNFSKKIAEKL